MSSGHMTLQAEYYEFAHDDGNDPELRLTYSKINQIMIEDTNGDWVKVDKYRYQRVHRLQSRVNDANLQQAFDKVQLRPQSDTEELIAERGTRYGEFKDGAAIMQQLKAVMKSAPKWEALKPSQKESLEMIQHKIGRILNGDPDYDDNWKDIAGYAMLIVKELSK